VKSKKEKALKEITAVYTLGGDGDVAQKDSELEAFAAKFNGERTSSGCYIPTGERDIQFAFANAGDAIRFNVEVKTLIAGWKRGAEINQSAGLARIARKAGPGIVFAGYQFGGKSAVFVDWETRHLYYLPPTASVEEIKNIRKQLRRFLRDRVEKRKATKSQQEAA
jgi:hypothetical protein